MLTDAQIERLQDAIGEAGACSDGDCSCKQLAHTAQDILDGRENYEVIDGN